MRNNLEPIIPERKKTGGNAPPSPTRIPAPPKEDQTENDGFAALVCGSDQDYGTRYHQWKKRRAEGSGFWESFRRVCEVILALQLSEVIRTLISNLIERICT